jgi:hypothetical protein
MGTVNRHPSLRGMLDDLEKRVRALETQRRFTIPVVTDWSYLPFTPQSGDLAMDAKTGFVYAYCIDADTTTTSNVTLAAGAGTFPVAQLSGFKPNDVVVLVSGGSAYLGVVSSAHVATSGAGNVTFTLKALNASPVPAKGVQTTVPSGTINSGARVYAPTWRQLVTATDLLTKFQVAGVGSALTTSWGGANSAAGSNTSGFGAQVATNGYKPYA